MKSKIHTRVLLPCPAFASLGGGHSKDEVRGEQANEEARA